MFGHDSIREYSIGLHQRKGVNKITKLACSLLRVWAKGIFDEGSLVFSGV